MWRDSQWKGTFYYNENDCIKFVQIVQFVDAVLIALLHEFISSTQSYYHRLPIIDEVIWIDIMAIVEFQAPLTSTQPEGWVDSIWALNAKMATSMHTHSCQHPHWDWFFAKQFVVSHCAPCGSLHDHFLEVNNEIHNNALQPQLEIHFHGHQAALLAMFLLNTLFIFF